MRRVPVQTCTKYYDEYKKKPQWSDDVHNQPFLDFVIIPEKREGF